MGTIYGIRIIAVIALLIFGSLPAIGQNFKRAEWSRVKMDSTYDGSKGKSTKIIEKHKATSPNLLKPIGKIDKELKSHQLSDFVTGAMLDYAAQRLARATKNPQAKADIAIVNFKNKKVSLPAGDITPSDIISLFPMDNQTVILDIKGKYVRELIKLSAKKGAFSSLEGESIEDDRIYKVITIDYFFRDDVCPDLLKKVEKLENCNMPMINVLTLHIRRHTQKGK